MYVYIYIYIHIYTYMHTYYTHIYIVISAPRYPSEADAAAQDPADACEKVYLVFNEDLACPCPLCNQFLVSYNIYIYIYICVYIYIYLLIHLFIHVEDLSPYNRRRIHRDIPTHPCSPPYSAPRYPYILVQCISYCRVQVF